MITLATNVRSVLVSASEVGPLLILRRHYVLFRQQQEAEAVFLIESGLVKVTRTGNAANRQIISIVGPHQLAGEECLPADACIHWAEAECVTDTTAYKIPLTTLRRLYGIPELATGLVSYAIACNLRSIDKAMMLAYNDVEQRILYGLAELARLVRPQLDGSAFSIPVTQAELASFIGATRETTSTTLSRLQSQKLVTLSRRLVTTVHPDVLETAANDRLSPARPPARKATA